MYDHVSIVTPDPNDDYEVVTNHIYNLEDMLNDPTVNITDKQRAYAKAKLEAIKHYMYATKR